MNSILRQTVVASNIFVQSADSLSKDRVSTFESPADLQSTINTSSPIVRIPHKEVELFDLEISVDFYKNIIRTLLNDETLLPNKKILEHILRPLGDVTIETKQITTQDI
jgi:hypothetical protein